MGIKDLFIERDDDQEEEIDLAALSAGLDNLALDSEEESEVEVTTNIVTDTYEQCGLSDLTKSIFKVEELSATLPKEMQDSVKRDTVTSIMTSFGLTVDTVVEDAETRTRELNAALNTATAKWTEENDSLKEEIESLKAQIAEREKAIASNKDMIESSSTIAKADGLVKFIKGE